MSDERIYEKAKIIYKKYAECKELQRKINAKMILSIVLTIAWYYIWIFSAIRYFNQPYSTFNPKNVLMYIAIFIIAIAPFYIFKPQKLLNFKPFLGILSDRRFSYLRFTRHSTQKYAEVVVKSIDGKKIKTFKMKAVDGLWSSYKQGSILLKLRGLDYPIVIEDALKAKLDDDTHMCPYCGYFNPVRYNRCFNCTNVVWNKNYNTTEK